MKTTDLKNKLSVLLSKLKTDKKFAAAFYALVILLLIGAYVALDGIGTAADANQDVDTQPALNANSEADTEARLEATLSCIRGAGKVKVMICYDTGAQIVPVMSTDTKTSISESNSGSSQTISETNTESSSPASVGGETVVITEKLPEVRGVIIIAEGAADPAVRIKLASAAQTVLGISADKVQVYEMSSDWEVEK